MNLNNFYSENIDYLEELFLEYKEKMLSEGDLDWKRNFIVNEDNLFWEFVENIYLEDL